MARPDGTIAALGPAIGIADVGAIVGATPASPAARRDDPGAPFGRVKSIIHRLAQTVCQLRKLFDGEKLALLNPLSDRAQLGQSRREAAGARPLIEPDHIERGGVEHCDGLAGSLGLAGGDERSELLQQDVLGGEKRQRAAAWKLDRCGGLSGSSPSRARLMRIA